MSEPVSKTTFAHGEAVGPKVAIVQGSFNELLAPGLAKAFLEAYHQIAIKHSIVKPGSAYNDINPYYEGPPVRELHVVDLGEGMLVPTELLRDLFGH